MFVLVTFGCSVRGVGSRCLSSNSMTSGAFESVSPGTVTKHHVMGSSALLFSWSSQNPYLYDCDGYYGDSEDDDVDGIGDATLATRRP